MLSEEVVGFSGVTHDPGFTEIAPGIVPKYDYKDPEAMNLIRNQLPVILTGADLVGPASGWTLEYLNENLGPGPFTVFTNRAPAQSEPHREHHIFKYFDEKKVPEFKGEFKSDITREEIRFDEFLLKFIGDKTKERVYFQQPLNSAVGKQIAADFICFNWKWAMEHQKEWGWGPLTANLLLIGQQGNVTPCHYDEQHNLFCQIEGAKKFVLFSPDHFPSMYPYPVHHPYDRQSQVDLENPDLIKFPKFSQVEGVQAILYPGDILYIPMYWWHHVINLTDTIAINFWYKAAANSPIEYPLKSRQKVAMVRNIEKMLLEALQDQQDLSTVLHWVVDGRF